MAELSAAALVQAPCALQATWWLVCMRCDAPICTSGDVLRSQLRTASPSDEASGTHRDGEASAGPGPNPSGSSSSGGRAGGSAAYFVYELEDLMDLDPVWIYNCTDETHTTVTHGAHTTTGSGGSVAVSAAGGPPALLPKPSVQQQRYDLIRVRADSVLGVSVVEEPLRESEEEEGADPVAATAEHAADAQGDASSSAASSSGGHNRHRATVALGGLAVSTTHRTGRSFRGWRTAATLACGECSADLGWLMAPSAGCSDRPTAAACAGDDRVPQVCASPVDGVAAGGSIASDPGSLPAAPPSLDADLEGRRFAMLQLVRLKQREWSPRDLQRQRWTAAAARRAAPATPALCAQCHGDGDELRGRVQVLQMQCTLYNTLLDRHKEQNQVQTALLSGQRDRMATLDDKLDTLQQIVEAQKQKLAMQARHIELQDLLIRDHREQAATQQTQIAVEQRLLADQNATIRAQMEQLRALRAHLCHAPPAALAVAGDPRSAIVFPGTAPPAGPGAEVQLALAASTAPPYGVGLPGRPLPPVPTVEEEAEGDVDGDGGGHASA
jgi:hypothetical protein